MDKYSPKFWASDVKVGQTIMLSDAQGIADSLKDGAGAAGTDYLIKAITSVENAELGVGWRLFEMYDVDETLYLMVKSVGDEMDLRVYFQPPEFISGNRRDALDSGQYWLFQEPGNPEDFAFDDLLFTLTIGDPVVPQVYVQKAFGVLFAEATFDPPQDSFNRCSAQIAEYQTEEECENPEIAILELGGERGDEGGLIMFLLGSAVSPEDVEVL